MRLRRTSDSSSSLYNLSRGSSASRGIETNVSTELVRNVFRIFFQIIDEEGNRARGFPVAQDSEYFRGEIDRVAGAVAFGNGANGGQRFFGPVEDRVQETMVKAEMSAGSRVQNLGWTHIE